MVGGEGSDAGKRKLDATGEGHDPEGRGDVEEGGEDSRWSDRNDDALASNDASMHSASLGRGDS